MAYHQTSTAFTLFHGVRNDIEFILRDADRRLYAIPDGATLTIHVTDLYSARLVLEKALDAIDPTKGHYRLSMAPTELTVAALGQYRYSVTCTDAEGGVTLLYSDRDHGPASALMVKDGPIPAQPDAILISPEDFTSGSNVNGVEGVSYYYTGAYAGAAQIGNFTGEHTVVLKLTEYTGDFTIQASLETAIPTEDTAWYDVSTTSFADATETASMSFNANCYHVRFLASKLDGINEVQFAN